MNQELVPTIPVIVLGSMLVLILFYAPTSYFVGHKLTKTIFAILSIVLAAVINSLYFFVLEITKVHVILAGKIITIHPDTGAILFSSFLLLVTGSIVFWGCKNAKASVLVLSVSTLLQLSLFLPPGFACILPMLLASLAVSLFNLNKLFTRQHSSLSLSFFLWNRVSDFLTLTGIGILSYAYSLEQTPEIAGYFATGSLLTFLGLFIRFSPAVTTEEIFVILFNDKRYLSSITFIMHYIFPVIMLFQLKDFMQNSPIGASPILASPRGAFIIILSVSIAFQLIWFLFLKNWRARVALIFATLPSAACLALYFNQTNITIALLCAAMLNIPFLTIKHGAHKLVKTWKTPQPISFTSIGRLTNIFFAAIIALLSIITNKIIWPVFIVGLQTAAPVIIFNIIKYPSRLFHNGNSQRMLGCALIGVIIISLYIIRTS